MFDFVSLCDSYKAVSDFKLGWRKEIIPPDRAGFGVVYKAPPPVHIGGIRTYGGNAVDGHKDKQDGGIISFRQP
ncbi:hypothetical protein DSCO28_54780 [Desulfosarcina ovata subsp. sediminis]|uniref:Uncharacterized protein n=1 Tax=Desulfosarcina ovata subsp. sediminis TaxID=885957 RepID=A0A5K7ZXD0_9BACT|nr:hypothetical protein [Desulfosarcina ovata]BBO84912.1 hypothetical protein DSCO28_54780 [Desulfosarcina ovata subsp. sediminis]